MSCRCAPAPAGRSCTASRAPSATSSTPGHGWPPSPPPRPWCGSPAVGCPSAWTDRPTTRRSDRERTGAEASRRGTSEERRAPRKRTEDIVTSAGAVEPTTTYEQAREELADVVRRLEAGGLTLEESLALWERGEELAKLCQHWLDRARERLAAAAPADQPEDGRPDSATVRSSSCGAEP